MPDTIETFRGALAGRGDRPFVQTDSATLSGSEFLASVERVAAVAPVVEPGAVVGIRALDPLTHLQVAFHVWEDGRGPANEMGVQMVSNQITIGFGECFFTIHHSCASHFAQFFDILCRYCHDFY